MRGMAGGSYRRSLTSTFFPELLSMNCLMVGMVPVMTIAMISEKYLKSMQNKMSGLEMKK